MNVVQVMGGLTNSTFLGCKCIYLFIKFFKMNSMNVFSICIEAIVNATHAFAHLSEQVLGSQSRQGVFFGFVIPVYTDSTQG